MRESGAPHFLVFMKILFRKILKYDLKKDKKNTYVFSLKLLAQKINPYSLEKGKFTPKTKVVFCSNLKRAKQCIKKNKNLIIINTKILNEIPFDLGICCEESDFHKYGSLAVRKTFKKLFIEDKLMITRAKIFSEIEKLFKSIKNYYGAEKSITIISHSFKLKCIEAYLKTNRKIIRSPKLINKYIKDKEKTFDFGKGFDFEI